MSSVVTWHPLADGIAPAWASGWGEDAWGPFVELTVKDVTQRLRWIPAGRFQMGSPDDDQLAQDREKPQHWVEISRGFWMFDTLTTQELWEAVMGEGENRSEFKSPHRPVERVSWDDCQQFFEKFSELAPDVKLGLPTEAEWEYACRAGTTDATYAGPMEVLGLNNAPILDLIAWYGGNCGVEWELSDAGHDTSGWPERQYEFARGGTRVVATRDPNPWGLYDTLGNVWEWCRDASFRDYADESVIDPFHDGEASASRVVRGGSWLLNARNVRAAYRSANSPGSRYNDIGFRCRVL
ncbi:MAG: formylglycine-generating enzyme family protein [Planctomycetales bacterium]